MKHGLPPSGDRKTRKGGSRPAPSGPNSPLQPALPGTSCSRRLLFGVCLLLAALTWGVFGQTLRFPFINFDDGVYVYDNPAVKGGLTLKGIFWAFTHSHGENWHPLTSLSHMLDCQLYGPNAGGHHLTNVLLHAATAILLFLVVRRMTAALWPSAFVAAVFAVHPLRVESVAWVAERKDVLSGVFFMLTLWAYARYAQKKSRGRDEVSSFKFQVSGGETSATTLSASNIQHSTSNSQLTTRNSPFSSLPVYCLVLLFFALGLMCKPMLVTLPFVLLLLDFWPLNRVSGVRCQVSGGETSVSKLSASNIQHPAHNSQLTTHNFRFPTLRSLIVEKIPLFLLSAATCGATLYVQHGAIRPIESVSFPLRMGNAVVSCATYLGEMIYPKNLAVFYPYPDSGLPPVKIVLALLVLVSISAAAFLWRQKRPYILVGWLWYLGMLVPVIGLVQVGMQAHADRYTYLPQMGVCVLLTWTAVEISASWRHRGWVLGAGAVGILAALMVCAKTQTGYWRDSESLWVHTISCTSGNAVAEGNLGNAFYQRGLLDEAIVHCQRAVEIRPDHVPALTGLGSVFLRKGQLNKAIDYFRQAVRFNPSYPSAQNNLGMALLQTGEVDEAITHFQHALEIDPDLVETRTDLGYAFLRKGRVEAAVAEYQRAIAVNPEFAPACNNLAWVLATCPRAAIRDGARAVEFAQRAARLSGGANPTILRTLAAAYAEAGRFPEAIEAARRCLRLGGVENNTALANALQAEIKLYQAGSSFRDPSQAP